MHTVKYYYKEWHDRSHGEAFKFMTEMVSELLNKAMPRILYVYFAVKQNSIFSFCVNFWRIEIIIWE